MWGGGGGGGGGGGVDKCLWAAFSQYVFKILMWKAEKIKNAGEQNCVHIAEIFVAHKHHKNNVYLVRFFSKNRPLYHFF